MESPIINEKSEIEASEQTILYWESISKSHRFSRTYNLERSKQEFKIRVFSGGKDAIQLQPFQHSMTKILKEYSKENKFLNPGNVKISIEYISNTSVSDKRWVPSQLIDYLLESDIHFILTHIHQGLTSKNIGWIIPSLLKNLDRLKYHPGFPFGDQLKCPVFTQDKIRYIKFIGDFAIPTYEIRITIPGSKHSSVELKALEEWCLGNETDNSGWVVKAPFTTNSHYVKFCHQLDDVFDYITSASEDLTVGFCQIPYLMVQPCLYNRKEYKVICLNGEPQYVATIGGNNLKCKDGINKAFGSHPELFQFCKTVLTEFKSRCPYSITEGLFRVDVLQMRSEKFVVNEFESLEATFYGTGEKKESNANRFIQTYWENQIRSLMRTSFEILSKSISSETKEKSKTILAINCFPSSIQTPQQSDDESSSEDT